MIEKRSRKKARIMRTHSLSFGLLLSLSVAIILTILR